MLAPGLKRASVAGLISDGAGNGSEDGGGVDDAGVTVNVVVRLVPA
jgi:hypothetical protein